MRSKLVISVLLAFVFAAGPTWAQVCSADKMQPLAACILKGLQKYPTLDGSSFNQWYEVQNHCDYEVEVVIQFSNGAEISVSLAQNEKDGASLPEGVEVTEFYCCSDSQTCE